MSQTWTRYTIPDYQEEPDKECSVEVKELTVLESEPLTNQDKLDAFLMQATDDDQRREFLLGMSHGYKIMLCKLMLASRSYQGFNGGDDQTALDAFLNGRPVKGLYPAWVAEVEAAIFYANRISEEEAKNSEGPSDTE